MNDTQAAFLAAALTKKKAGKEAEQVLLASCCPEAETQALSKATRLIILFLELSLHTQHGRHKNRISKDEKKKAKRKMLHGLP